MMRLESPLVGVFASIIIPSLILIHASQFFGPKVTLLVALAFPISYTLGVKLRAKRWDLIGGLGFVSILLTGGIGLLEADPIWIAIKEAGVPLVLGVAVLLSMRQNSLLKAMVLNDAVIDHELIERKASEHKKRKELDEMFRLGSYVLAGALFLGAALNFILARLIVTSDPSTPEFTQELGRLAALSVPGLVVPVMVVLTFLIIYLFRRLSQITGLSLEELIKEK